MTVRGARRLAAWLAAAAVWPWATPMAAANEPATEPAHVHVATRGDTLIGLGRRLLADPSTWPEVARLNALPDPNRVPVGTALRIPLRLMRTESAPATVLSVTGQATTAAGAALGVNQPLDEGSEIATGPDGHVSVRLVDGTVLRLRPSSRLQLRESRRLPDAGLTNSGVRLPRGRVEIDAAPTQGGKPGFRIDTPQGVLGVRGTSFRVATEGDQAATRGEVLTGTVGFSGAASGAAAVPVPQGFGSVIGADGVVAPLVKLLDVPVVAGLPNLQERLLVRFTLPVVPGAAAYRVLVAPAAAPEAVQADLLSATPELRIDGLADGDYRLRVRGVDGSGLEGRDAEHAFTLKARPEAPLPSAPEPRAVLFGGRVEFAWTLNPEARTYRLQLGGAAGFEPPLREWTDVTGAATSVDALAPGNYQWRLASVRADGDRGPWSPAREFQMRPSPPVARPPAVGAQTVGFEWEALPGQTFDFEVARDPAFANLLLERRLTEPRISLPLPAPGRYHVRLRAREADGFIGPYTSPQQFEVINCLRDAGGGCVRAADAPMTMPP